MQKCVLVLTADGDNIDELIASIARGAESAKRQLLERGVVRNQIASNESGPGYQYDSAIVNGDRDRLYKIHLAAVEEMDKHVPLELEKNDA